MQYMRSGHKFLVSVIIILLCSSSVFSRNVIKNIPSFDNDPLNFGFTLGITYMNFSTTNSGVADAGGDIWYSDVSTPTPGFHVGIISSFRLHRFFNLRIIPSISLGQRNLRFVTPRANSFGETMMYEREDGEAVPVKSTFIEVPMLIKYKAVRDGNARPYLIGGINPRYDLARSKKDDILLKPFDLYFEIGVGSDFYLQYFRFGIEAKFSVGLNDMLERNRGNAERYNPAYTNSISKLTSRLFIISFNFE